MRTGLTAAICVLLQSHVQGNLKFAGRYTVALPVFYCLPRQSDLKLQLHQEHYYRQLQLKHQYTGDPPTPGISPLTGFAVGGALLWLTVGIWRVSPTYLHTARAPPLSRSRFSLPCQFPSAPAWAMCYHSSCAYSQAAWVIVVDYTLSLEKGNRYGSSLCLQSSG